MKKRCFLLSILLIISMMCGACGTGNPFEGKWTGKLDVTKQFEDGIKAHCKEYCPELEKYVDFEDLVFEIGVEFNDGILTMKVDRASEERFKENFEAGMMKIEEGGIIEYLEAADLIEEKEMLAAELDMSVEEYIDHLLSEVDEIKNMFDNMETNMSIVTEASLAGFNAVHGPYTFNEEEIHVRYEDDKYESIAYAFDGDNLILTFRGEIEGDGENEGIKFSLRIECEKQ